MGGILVTVHGSKDDIKKVKNQIWELDNNKNIKINEEELDLISLKINSFYC